MDSEFRPWTQDERGVVGRLIREFYNQFLERVAAGRRMSTADVHAVGEGRVFAGARARGLRLVDRLGGIDLAVERASVLAGLGDDFDVVEYPQETSGLFSTLASLLLDDRTHAPAARLLAQSDLRAALGWLYALTEIGRGHAAAMTEWPILAP
jgi:protease-4